MRAWRTLGLLGALIGACVAAACSKSAAKPPGIEEPGPSAHGSGSNPAGDAGSSTRDAGPSGSLVTAPNLITGLALTASDVFFLTTGADDAGAPTGVLARVPRTGAAPHTPQLVVTRGIGTRTDPRNR